MVARKRARIVCMLFSRYHIDSYVKSAYQSNIRKSGGSIMNKNDIVQAIMSQLGTAAGAPVADANGPIKGKEQQAPCSLTEFVGVSQGYTIGLVIANVDQGFAQRLNFKKPYRSLGVVGSRSGAAPHAMAADEAIKSSNTECLIFDLPRDTEGDGGHGCFLVFGADEVSDARRAVEITLATLPGYFGDSFRNDAGHVEAQYTARASHVLSDFFEAEEGKAFGLISCCPAAIGMVTADITSKAADIKIVKHATPSFGTSTSNEFMIFFTGDSGAVKQAAIAGRDAAKKMLEALGGELTPLGESYIK